MEPRTAQSIQGDVAPMLNAVGESAFWLSHYAVFNAS